jgi:hypothetical protein
MPMRFWITFFADVFGLDLTAEELTLDELAERIGATVAAAKDRLPLLKFATFGSKRSPTANGGGNSLRWNENVISTSGVEGDHDKGGMPVDEVVRRLDAAGITYVVYTTPSHTVAEPHWRAICPFSQPLPPTERARMANRLNGLVGGTLAPESWALSQAFYFGAVDGQAHAEVYVGDAEQCIDEADHLGPGLPYSPPSGTGGAGVPKYKDLTDYECLAEITSGRHYYGPSKELIYRWATQGLDAADTEAKLRAAFDQVPAAQRDRKWANIVGRDLRRWIDAGYARVAKRKGTFLANLVEFLSSDGWEGVIRRNDFTALIEVVDPFPPQPGQALDYRRALRDPDDILECLLHVQANGFPNANKGNIWDGLNVVAKRNAYHPVTQWLRRLEWDGDVRLNRLFLDYFPAELPEEADREYHDEVVAYLEKTSECFMVGAVARVMEPGCKLDCLPCLISPQGFNKSKGLQALVPDPRWFSDDLSTNVTDRDAKESLGGKWIIELSEFPHIRRDVDRVKAFFSRQVDRFRVAYGRANADHPRQAVFCATANILEFIDVTGNRRVWPVSLAKEVDVEAIMRDRDQLWAEAVHLYDRDYKWWLPPGIEAIAAAVQDAYLEDDGFDELIINWLTTKARRGANGELLPFGLRALAEGLGFSYTPGERNLITRSDEMRLARRLRRLGFRPEPRRPRQDGHRVRLWVRVQQLVNRGAAECSFKE